MAGMNIKPNKPETLLLELADIACPNEYKFTGDGEIIIDGLCPDLFNINGKKKLFLCTAIIGIKARMDKL